MFNFTLFFILLIPNWLRQISYYFAYKKTKQVAFCESYETLWFMKKGYWILGYLEEIGFAILWTSLFPIAPFLAYGWVFDALQDITIALVTPKKSPYHIFGKDLWKRELIREILVPYGVVGPLISIIL